MASNPEGEPRGARWLTDKLLANSDRLWVILATALAIVTAVLSLLPQLPLAPILRWAIILLSLGINLYVLFHLLRDHQSATAELQQTENNLETCRMKLKEAGVALSQKDDLLRQVESRIKTIRKDLNCHKRSLAWTRQQLAEKVATMSPDARAREQTIIQLERDRSALEQKLARLQQADQTAKRHHNHLRRSLLCGGLQLAPRPAFPQPSYVLLDAFTTFRDQHFLNLAQRLSQQLSAIPTNKWQIELTRHIFLQGAPSFLESLVRRPRATSPPPADEETRLLEGHRRRISALLLKSLDTAGQVDPATRATLEQVIERGLRLAWDVVSSPAQCWFILPGEGALFDPALHSTSESHQEPPWQVDKLIFPGLVTRGSPDTVEPAQVTVRAVEVAPLISPPAPRPGVPQAAGRGPAPGP